LLAAYGESVDIWWTVEEIVGKESAIPEHGNLSALRGLDLACQVEVLGQCPLAQRILLRDLNESNCLTPKLKELRETRT
jgi:hypothetical protein